MRAIPKTPGRPRAQVVSPVNLLLQAYLFSPSFSGDGRWAIFDPHSKRSFLLSGKEHFPRLLDVLLKVNRGAADRSSGSVLSAVAPLLRGANEAKRLRDITRAPDDYLSKYQLAVFDYDFFDYSDPGWRERDAQLMLTYGRSEKPPGNFASRKGRVHQLSGAGSQLPEEDNSLRAALARALRLSLSPIGEIPGHPYGPWLRRTSPSGGARHPTEAVLLLPVGRFGLGGGAYYFDGRAEVLIAVRDGRYDKSLSALSRDEIGILLTSRVERAMWRYREPRALRPVVIDAGHIALTMALVLGEMGYSCAVESSVNASDQEFSWLTDLPLALIRIPSPTVSASKAATARPIIEAAEESKKSRLLLNPTAYLSIEGDKLILRILWPKQVIRQVTRQEFLLLTHCIFSRRGDRSTERVLLARKFPRIPEAKLQGLVNDQILQPAETVKAFLKNSAPWISKAWYLSMLAYLAEAGRFEGVKKEVSALSGRALSLFSGDSEDLEKVLLARRTTRQFAEIPISSQQLDDIERTLLEFGRGCSSSNIRIFFNLQRVQGKAPRLYELRLSDGARVRRPRAMATKDVRRLTIGQAAAGAGALSIWLVADLLAVDSPRSYFAQLLALGVWGQVVCLKVTQLNLGVFLTPAVRDSDLLEYLGISEPEGKAVYFFSVGFRK